MGRLEPTIDTDCLKKKDKKYIEGLLSAGESIDNYTSIYLETFDNVPGSIRGMIREVIEDYVEGLKTDLCVLADEKMMEMIMGYDE